MAATARLRASALGSALGPALLLVALCGCGPGGAAPAPGPCREFGALCKLDSGPLGVCESRPCSGSESAPCFTCTPQH